MSEEKLEQALRNWREKLAEYEHELSITSSSPQKFELRKRIQECEEQINRIKTNIESLEKGNKPSIAQLQTQPALPSPAVVSQLEPTSDSENQTIEVFFSYAHEDEELRDELAKHLSLLERQKVIAAWYDREIGAGTEWKHSIEQRLNSADVILLLISADFLASDFCWGIELKRAMERHEAGKARVIPVILRPVYWQGAQFGQLQALPKNAKPITTWSNQDEAFLDVARGIRQVVEELQEPEELEKPVSPSPKLDETQRSQETTSPSPKPTISSSPEPKAEPRSDKEVSMSDPHIQIFLAHASEDKAEVLKLYDRLKARGYKPWLDKKKDLLPGQNWREEIPKAIKKSQIFIACFSQQSVRKEGYFQKEFRMALKEYGEKPPDTIYFIPLKLDDCEVPDVQLPQEGRNLRDIQWQNYWEPDGFENLVKAIEHERRNLKQKERAKKIEIQPTVISLSPPVTTDSEHLQTQHPSASGIPASVAPLKPGRSPPWKLICVIGLAVVVAIVGIMTEPPSSDPTILISGETKVDYNSLNRLLAKETKEKWRKADEKTLELMLTAAGRESIKQSALIEEDLKEFSCEDLKIIDDLWVDHSKGRFGFSVQNEIYLDEGNNPEEYDEKAFESFGKKVGWREGGEWKDDYDWFDFSIEARPGHLPTAFWRHVAWPKGGENFEALSSRLTVCKIFPKNRTIKNL